MFSLAVDSVKDISLTENRIIYGKFGSNSLLLYPAFKTQREFPAVNGLKYVYQNINYIKLLLESISNMYIKFCSH